MNMNRYDTHIDRDEIKISVIVPVYNVEKYLRKAVDSILSQTLTELELFLVDDGSTDSCGKICDSYAAEDSRVKVIHKENGGAPSARNMALDRACGKYVFFMDADDWAEPDMLMDMYAFAERDYAQIVVAGFYIDTYSGDKICRTDEFKIDDMVFKNRQAFREAAWRLFDKNLLYAPWNKLWLRKYLEDGQMRFPKTFWDDFPFILSVIRDVDRVTVTAYMYYHFNRARDDSETSGYREGMYEKREEEHGWMKELYRYWGVNDPASREMVARRYIERFVGCVVNLMNPKCKGTLAEKRRTIKQWILSNNVRHSLKITRPHSFMMLAMLLPIRMKNVTLTMLEGMFINWVKSNDVATFARLKATR